MFYRLILPEWAKQEQPSLPKVLEGDFSDDQLQHYNEQGYNIYFTPNFPSTYDNTVPVSGRDIDNFNVVFVDMDLKDKVYEDKQSFINILMGNEKMLPTLIIDSGGGIHAYWSVIDLDPMSYLRLSRRLVRHFNTDEAVGQIFQLMRYSGTVNMKDPNNLRLCEVVSETDNVYSAEQLDRLLPAISDKDEQHCLQHYNKTYQIDVPNINIDDTIPLKFMQLLRNNSEVKAIWSSPSTDRSGGDFRLGHIMYAQGFAKEEAASVLVNGAKALARGPSHRVTYAMNIIDKIWIHEESSNKLSLDLSSTVEDILNKYEGSIKGIRFPCHRYMDNTDGGFRLGQVIGLVAGSGVGKTAVALNMFKGFVENNPDYDHIFIPLEQPSREIADRWKTMCGDNTRLHSRVHVMSNYNDDGGYRHLSLGEIEEYIVKLQMNNKRKIGCVVIDHIGVLKSANKNGENEGLMGICKAMKAFATKTNTVLIMQSQAPREKSGIGDLELNKDAAYGTMFFEAYCDYLITLWQPLKRCYTEVGCPLVTAFKFCKIRHKKQHLDVIKEDVCYSLIFDPETEHLRETTQLEDKSFAFFLQKATNKRKQDRKTDLVSYVSTRGAN